MAVPRRKLVAGMIFGNKSINELLVLVRKDNTNTWECEYLSGDDPEEYVRHDYIFTDASHGFELVGFKYENKTFFFDMSDMRNCFNAGAESEKVFDKYITDTHGMDVEVMENIPESEYY